MEVNFRKERTLPWPSQGHRTGCAAPRNCGFRGRMPPSFGTKSNLGSANDGKSEKESWQDDGEACVPGAAGVLVDSRGCTASGSSGSGGACKGKTAAKDFGTAGGKSG